MDATPSHPYPSNLRLQVRRAARLSHALARLVDRTEPSDVSFVWLVGRSDEVRAVVGTAMREWQEGRVDERVAADRISSYVRELEETVEAFFHRRRPEPSRVVARFRPASDTLIDVAVAQKGT
jgi:hypothetical protein